MKNANVWIQFSRNDVLTRFFQRHSSTAEWICNLIEVLERVSDSLGSLVALFFFFFFFFFFWKKKKSVPFSKNCVKITMRKLKNRPTSLPRHKIEEVLWYFFFFLKVMVEEWHWKNVYRDFPGFPDFQIESSPPQKELRVEMKYAKWPQKTPLQHDIGPISLSQTVFHLWLFYE